MVFMWQALAMFSAIFLAEMGDKTQVATILFASEEKNSPLVVFVTSASALVIGAAISTMLGAAGGKWFAHVPVKLIAGIGFIAIGAWSIISHYRGA
jgi:putative Ca2+/H+ antiporter (TMEM165/GDT1 family)